jgi:hypothetical protein
LLYRFAGYSWNKDRISKANAIMWLENQGKIDSVAPVATKLKGLYCAL